MPVQILAYWYATASPMETLAVKAKERQITFYADPDVFEWLKSQSSVTRTINHLIRQAMNQASATEESDALAPPFASRAGAGLRDSPIDRVVTELEEIQQAILLSYDRQQAMIGALRTHQKLFEKSASFYREIGRIRDENRARAQVEEVVSSYDELLENSHDSIMHIIASSEHDLESLERSSVFKQKLIAAVKTDDFEDRDVGAPARSFKPKFARGGDLK